MNSAKHRTTNASRRNPLIRRASQSPVLDSHIEKIGGFAACQKCNSLPQWKCQRTSRYRTEILGVRPAVLVVRRFRPAGPFAWCIARRRSPGKLDVEGQGWSPKTRQWMIESTSHRATPAPVQAARVRGFGVIRSGVPGVGCSSPMAKRPEPKRQLAGGIAWGTGRPLSTKHQASPLGCTFPWLGDLIRAGASRVLNLVWGARGSRSGRPSIPHSSFALSCSENLAAVRGARAWRFWLNRKGRKGRRQQDHGHDVQYPSHVRLLVHLDGGHSP